MGAGVSLLTGLAMAQPRPTRPPRQPAPEHVAVQEEKERAFALAGAQQTGTIRRLSVGRLLIDPYNPASNVNTFLIPQITPIYQGDHKVTQDALVPGASVRIHFRESPVLNQPARAIAIEILSISESRAAKQASLQSPPVMNKGIGLISPVPPPEKAEVLADATGSKVGRIARLNDTSMQIAETGVPNLQKLRVDPFVSVFEGTQRVGTDRLEPGSDVRVYYKQPSPVGPPLVIAVDLLREPEGGMGPPAPK
jgi:hypothetical protein